MPKRLLLLLSILVLVAGGPVAAQQQQRSNQERPRWVEAPPPPDEPVVEEEPPAAPPDAQDDRSSQVELSSNLVTITVTVRDASGGLVTDLAPSEFVVYENGVKQDVDQFFRQGEMPLRLALLFDASLSIKNRLDFEKRASERFFARMVQNGDHAMLVTVATDWKVEQPMTASAGALVDAVERIEAGGITSLYQAVQGTSKLLDEVDGRRVMVVLSDGYDTSGRNLLAQTLEEAQKADVVIYAISPFGLGESINVAARVGSETLRRLTAETGGVAFFPPIERDPRLEAEALDRIYSRLVEELRAQYVLTYYSTSPKDGSFRTLKVDVTRPGLKVSARKGYYAT